LKSPSLEHIAETPHYKILLEHASKLEHIVGENREQITRLAEELSQVQASRKEFEDNAVASGKSTVLYSSSPYSCPRMLQGK
jgi:E3 ubiquitin-protein ligase BRE1